MKEKGQQTFRVLATDAEEFATKTHKLFLSVAAKAQRARAIITNGGNPFEVEQVLAEIEREALTGRIEQ